MRPDLRGDLEMVDAETGEEVPVSLSPALREYAEVDAWLAETAGSLPTSRRLVRVWPTSREASCRTWRERLGAMTDSRGSRSVALGWRPSGLVR